MNRPRYSLRNGAEMPGMGGRGPRERQSVWCCGVSYQRWRFVGKEFPGTHHATCVHCGRRLAWPAGELERKPTAAEKRRRNRSVWRASYQRRSRRFQLAGRTARGTDRKRRPSVSPQYLAWLDLRQSLATTPET